MFPTCYKVIYSLVAIPLPLYFEHPKVDTRHLDFLCYRQIHTTLVRERSGSVVECLTQDRGAVGLSLTTFRSKKRIKGQNFCQTTEDLSFHRSGYLSNDRYMLFEMLQYQINCTIRKNRILVHVENSSY